MHENGRTLQDNPPIASQVSLVTRLDQGYAFNNEIH